MARLNCPGTGLLLSRAGTNFAPSQALTATAPSPLLALLSLTIFVPVRFPLASTLHITSADGNAEYCVTKLRQVYILRSKSSKLASIWGLNIISPGRCLGFVGRS